MKTLKKLFCTFLAVTMIILSSFVGIFAVEEPTMTVSSGSAVAGQTVELDVVLSGNTGISFATLEPKYDKSLLELVDVKYNLEKFPGEERFDGTYARWKSTEKDNMENGVFLKLVFRALETTEAGKSEVSLSCPKGYIAGEKSRYTNVDIISGTIDIIPDTPKFELSSAYALQGETATINVSLKNNPGIAAAEITPVYDKTVLELVKINCNHYEYDMSYMISNSGIVTWSSEGNEDNTKNTIFVTYVFKVLDTAGAESTEVTLTYEEDSIVNSKGERVEFAVDSGAVIFKETPYILTVSSPEALPGETVEVDVSMTNNPGISSAELIPVYDKTALELIDVNLNRSVFVGHIELTENGEVLLAEDITRNEVSDGILFTLVFRVLDTAKNGESEVTLSYEEEGFIHKRDRVGGLKYKIVPGSVGIKSPALKVLSSETIPGDTVKVDVSIENNPGIAAAQLIPVYDDTVLELIDVKLNNMDFDGQIELTESNKVVFSFSEDKVSDGVLFTLVFRVLDTVKAGTSEITLLYEDGDIVNKNEDSIKFRIKSGSVEVMVPEIKISSSEVIPGETVKVDVSLKNNPGIESASLELVYDDTVLELLDVNFNYGLGMMTEHRVVWSSSNLENYTEDGVLFTLTFRILDTAKVGTSEITLAYEDGGIINKNENDIKFIVESGMINVRIPEPAIHMFSLVFDAKAGDTVECMVRLENNPGIVSAQFTPVYDKEIFELTGVRFNLGIFDGHGELTENNKIVWTSKESKDNVLDGTILTLVFKVLDTDEVRSSEISIFCGENDILNSNEDYIQFDVSSARSSINIVKIPEFKVSSVYAVSGETVKVDVSIENNPGIFSVAFNPVYDETVLEFTGVDYNFELFPGGTLTGNAQNGEEFKIWGIFNRFDGCEKNCENGVFMTLNFRVLDTAKAEATEVSLLSYAQEYRGRENVNFNVVPGTVRIAEVPFDINGDGKVNSKDLVRLMKYISEDGEGIEVFADTDINGDGVTNAKDIVRIMKNFAMTE